MAYIDFSGVVPDTSMTPQEIQSFLLKYPTAEKAASAMAVAKTLGKTIDPNLSNWASIASTGAGLEFLQAHAKNRRDAGDTSEATLLDKYVNQISQANALRSQGIGKLGLPLLAPPKPEPNARFVERADFENPLLIHPTNPLRIPLITPPKA